jgi:hypothetical protein
VGVDAERSVGVLGGEYGAHERCAFTHPDEFVFAARLR